MAHSVTASRALQGALSRAAARQCQRCFSSGALTGPKLRPALPAQARQPMTQRRTKYKTVEQAKSRHSTGVRRR